MPGAGVPSSIRAKQRLDAAVGQAKEIFGEQRADGILIPSWFVFDESGTLTTRSALPTQGPVPDSVVVEGLTNHDDAQTHVLLRTDGPEPRMLAWDKDGAKAIYRPKDSDADVWEWQEERISAFDDTPPEVSADWEGDAAPAGDDDPLEHIVRDTYGKIAGWAEAETDATEADLTELTTFDAGPVWQHAEPPPGEPGQDMAQRLTAVLAHVNELGHTPATVRFSSGGTWYLLAVNADPEDPSAFLQAFRVRDGELQVTERNDLTEDLWPKG